MKTREKVAIGDKKEVVEVGWSDIEGVPIGMYAWSIS